MVIQFTFKSLICKGNNIINNYTKRNFLGFPNFMYSKATEISSNNQWRKLKESKRSKSGIKGVSKDACSDIFMS